MFNLAKGLCSVNGLSVNLGIPLFNMHHTVKKLLKVCVTVERRVLVHSPIPGCCQWWYRACKMDAAISWGPGKQPEVSSWQRNIGSLTQVWGFSSLWVTAVLGKIGFGGSQICHLCPLPTLNHPGPPSPTQFCPSPFPLTRNISQSLSMEITVCRCCLSFNWCWRTLFFRPPKDLWDVYDST